MRYFNIEKKERECSRCGKIKSFSEFHFEGNTKVPRSKCKACVAEYAIEYSKKYKPKLTREERNTRRSKYYHNKQERACKTSGIEVDEEAAKKYMASKRKVGLR